MSRAIRTRSASAAVSARATSRSCRVSRARREVRTRAPIVHDSPRAKTAATSTIAATGRVSHDTAAPPESGPTKRYTVPMPAPAIAEPRPTQNTWRVPYAAAV